MIFVKENTMDFRLNQYSLINQYGVTVSVVDLKIILQTLKTKEILCVYCF